MYKKVQEDIANRAVKTFHITVENGLLSELAEWISTISNLHEKIEVAESTRTSAHDTQNRLISLQTEYQKEKDKKSKSSKGLFGRNAEQIDENLKDLQIRIKEASDGQESLSTEYKNARNAIAQSVKQLMEKRYRYFDRIYVQMLECQSEYFQHAANETKKFQRDIDYYRKQFPKTHTFQHSNGSESKDFGDHGFNMSNSTHSNHASPQHSPLKNGGHRHSNKTKSPPNKPKVPNAKAPKLSSKQQRQQQQQQLQDHHHMNGRGCIGSLSSSPITQSPLTPNPADAATPTPMGDVFKSQQQNISVTTKPTHVNRQLSTHDMLDFNGPITPSKVGKGSNVKKQDSMWGNILDTGDGNKDTFGLHDLAAEESNTLFDLPNGNNNEQQSDGDIFSGITGMFETDNSAKKQHPKTNNSTGIYLLDMHNPVSSSSDDHKQSNMHDAMMKNFNQPSYGGGHSQSNNVKLNASHTQKVHKNGAKAVPSSTAHINNQDMSTKDKEAMATMKITGRSAQNAQKAYLDAMGKRQEEEQKAKQRLKEIAYWKDKHEQKLNEWEYKDTMRRNIRTLIGKMPDVLPADLKWKPIAMTKLLDDAQLKKGYYKAVRVVHPDKSIGRGDSIENQVICDYVFQALEQAYNKQFG